MPVGCWFVWEREQEGPKAGLGLTPAAPSPGVGLVATAEARWGSSGPPGVIGALGPISVGSLSLGGGFWQCGRGRVLHCGVEGPCAPVGSGLQPAEGSEQKW